jgi:hypothetical protein
MRAHAQTVANDSVEWKDDLDGKLEGMTDSLEEATNYVVKLIKKRPLLFLGGAVVLGYVVGRLVRR